MCATLCLERLQPGVASIAGTSFGAYGEGYLRISYANSEENIAEAIRRMRGFLEQRKKAAEYIATKGQPHRRPYFFAASPGA
jgi:hypothetical protein